MFFSARKARAEKQIQKKEPLINKSEIISLLKEALSGIGEFPSKQKQYTPNNLLTISNNYYFEEKQRQCKSLNIDLDSRDREVIVPFFYQFDAKNIQLQHDLFHIEKIKMAEKMKFIGIYNEKQAISMPKAGRFNQNHSKSIRKAAQLIRIKLESRTMKEEDQLYQSLKNELRTIENKSEVYQQLLKFVKDENQLKLNTIFQRDQTYQQYICFVKEYLSQMVQIVCSTAFSLFNEEKLTDNELKAYASKNILQNIRIVLVETRNAFRKAGKSQIFNSDFNYSEEIMIRITKDIDSYLQISLGQLSAHYPQASGGGQTVRMRESILKINRAEDETNDLLFLKNIKISKYSKRQNEDKYLKYSGFIMEVINAAINSTRQTYSEGSNQTVFEKFQEFSEKLFVINSLSEHQKYKNILKVTDSSQFSSFSNFYENIFDKLKQNKEPKNSIDRNADQNSLHISKTLQVDRLQYIYDEQCGSVRNQHKYAIGQKISNQVRPFAQNQIQSKTFVVKNSSILRIMTKWVQFLQQFFENPQIMIKKRIYNFKNVDNQLCNLLKDSKRDQKQTLCKNLKKQGLFVKEQFKQLKNKNTIFQSFFLSDQQNNGRSFIKKFTQARVASSSINAILIQFTHQYLCVLIHHLLKAGQDICDQRTTKQNINLVSLRVGDLLRSKMECNESSFLNIVKTLNFLDQCKQMKGIFKLVRVKNKLNQRDNNILINYLFLGKVQCELQLSIQNMKTKQKNYYSFCHFLYELTRGKFGVLTQLSTIVCQHDPVVSSIKQVMYNPKRYNKLEKKRKHQKGNVQTVDQCKQLSLKIHKKDKHYYICPKCKKIKVNQNVNLFNQEQRNCNQCIIAQIIKNSYKLQKILQKISIKHQSIIDYLISQKVFLTNIRNYGQFSTLKNTRSKYSIIFTLSSENNTVNLKPYMVYYHEKEFQYFKIELSNQILAEQRLQSITYEEIDYVNITDAVVKGNTLNEIVFIQGVQKDLCLPGNISVTKHNCDKYAKVFHRFRLQKSIIKEIRSKGQILDLSNDSTQLQHIQCIKSLNSILVSNKAGIKQKIKKKMHRNKQNTSLTTNCIYNKYTMISPQKLKKLQLAMIGLTDTRLLSYLSKDILQLNLSNNLIDKFQLKQAKELKILRVVNNKMKQLNIESNIHLSQIYGGNNKIVKIDLSNNIELAFIDFNNNLLTQINLSQNSLLKDIHLISNKLTNIIFPQNNTIQKMSIGGNDLRQINLTKITALTTLNLLNSKLITIDLSKNQQLNTLFIGYNQIETIDLSSNQKLHQLYLNNNKIKSIDLSKNYELQSLTISNNKLVQIDVSQNNQLSSLIVTANQLQRVKFPTKSKLKTFRSNTNKIKDIDLSQNSQLAYLDMARNLLTKINLESNKQILAVDLRENKLTQVKLSKCKQLNTLCLLSNCLTSIDLSQNVNLTDLYLNKNGLKSVDLSKNNRIYNAYLNNNQISSIILPTEVQELSTLNLNYNKLTEIDVSKFRQLRTLSASNNNLKSIDISANDQLSIVDLSKNQLEQINLASYGQFKMLSLQVNVLKKLAIPQDIELERIDLSENPLESLHIFYKKNLQSLSLNKITSQNVQVILLHRKGEFADCEVFKRSLQKNYDKSNGYLFRVKEINE